MMMTSEIGRIGRVLTLIHFKIYSFRLPTQHAWRASYQI